MYQFFMKWKTKKIQTAPSLMKSTLKMKILLQMAPNVDSMGDGSIMVKQHASTIKIIDVGTVDGSL